MKWWGNGERGTGADEGEFGPAVERTRSIASLITSLRVLVEKVVTRWNASLPSFVYFVVSTLSFCAGLV
jgi:hypothetical protein